MLVVSLARAWCVAHRALPGMIGMCVVTLLVALFANVKVASVWDSTTFPVWGMFPPALAVCVATMAENRLPTIPGRSLRMAPARLAWCISLLATTFVSSSLISGLINYDRLVTESLWLASLSIGSSVLIGRYNAVVGLAVLGMVASRGGVTSFIGLSYWYADFEGRTWVWLSTITVSGLLGYVVLGSRSGPSHAAADG